MSSQRLLVFLLAFAAALGANAQSVRLQGSADRDAVRLLWTVTDWSSDWDGFQVSRRPSGGSWTALTQSIVAPAIDINRDLSEVEPDDAERRRLIAKLQSLVQDGLVELVDSQTYVETISGDRDVLEGVQAALLNDYDLALIEGFALVDRDAPRGRRTEYGLFPVISGRAANSPVATWEWDGTVSTFALEPEVGLEPQRADTGLLVTFTTTVSDFEALSLKGFNLYRSDGRGGSERLGDAVLPVGFLGDEASGSFLDRGVDLNGQATYALLPVDAFGNEGTGATVTYNPAAYAMPEMPVLVAASRDAAGAMQLTWSFLTADQAAIDGFVVERIDFDAEEGEEATPVSSLLEPGQRSFADVSLAAVGVFVGYRVVIVQRGVAIGSSAELVVYAGAFRTPPQPQNIQAEVETGTGRSSIIRLSWDARAANDTLTAKYHLYANRPPEDVLLREASLPTITGNRLAYEVFDAYGAVYNFQLAAVSGDDLESDRTDTLSVYVPARLMRDVTIWPFRVDSSAVTLEWQYQTTPDLEGFRLYRDGELVADVDQLGPAVRQSTRGPLEIGTYVWEIEAVSSFGPVSRRSQPRRTRVR